MMIQRVFLDHNTPALNISRLAFRHSDALTSMSAYFFASDSWNVDGFSFTCRLHNAEVWLRGDYDEDEHELTLGLTSNGSIVYTSGYMPVSAQAQAKLLELLKPDCRHTLQSAIALPAVPVIYTEPPMDVLHQDTIAFGSTAYMVNGNTSSVYDFEALNQWFHVKCTDPLTNVPVVSVAKITVQESVGGGARGRTARKGPLAGSRRSHRKAPFKSRAHRSRSVKTSRHQT